MSRKYRTGLSTVEKQAISLIEGDLSVIEMLHLSTTDPAAEEQTVYLRQVPPFQSCDTVAPLVSAPS
jgi:hypothetical protein